MKGNIILFICLAFLFFLLSSYYYGINTNYELFQSQTYEIPDRIFLINMEERKDRLDFFTNKYNASDCKDKLILERIPAIIGKNIDWKNGILTKVGMDDLEYTMQKGKRRNHSSLSLGAVGCYLSHLEMMKKVVALNKPAIVCEDDIIFPPDFLEKVHDALRNVPYSPKAIIFFHIFCNGWELKCIPIHGNVLKVEQFWSTACYYITPESAKIFLEKGTPIEMQIDASMSLLAQKEQLNLYAYPFIGTNLDFGSDIQTAVE
jgi:glycosyl transferase family 25